MKIHWKYLALTLLIGWFIGAASGLLFMRYNGPGRHPGRMRHRFEKELKLSPDQTTNVEAILQTGRQTMDQIYAQTRPRIEAVRASTAAQIRQILMPDQQLVFDKLEAKRRKHFEQRLDRRLPPPSPEPEKQPQ